VKYDETLTLTEVNGADKSGSTGSPLVAYELVAVVVHLGNNLSSGHYVCFMKRNRLWYCADDAHIKECTAFEATSQQAYLLFYEKADASDVPEVEVPHDLTSFPSATDTKQNPCKENIQIQQATPPSFYITEPCFDVQAAAVCKTAKGSPALQYMSICDSEKEQAELIVTMGHTIQDHPRTKGWQEQDLRRLLPGQEEEGSWLNNFVLNKIFLLIEEKATAVGNKVRTLNSDIFTRMITSSTEIFKRYNFHQLYPNIFDSEVILAPFNHGRHWCLVVVSMKEKMSIYLDSLYNGAGAKMAFSRMNNFLTSSASIMGRNWDMHDWQYFAIPSSDIPQQLNSDDCGVFVAKWAQHISVGLPLDFSHPDIVNFRYSLILDIARNALSMDIKVPSTQIRKETLTRTTAASSQRSTTSTPHRVSMTNQTSVSNKVTPASSPNNHASAAKQTSVSNKASHTTKPNISQAYAAKQTSLANKANPTTSPKSQDSTSKQTSASNKATAATSPNSQASAAKQTSASDKANPTTSPNSKVCASKQTSVSQKANPNTSPHSQVSAPKQTSLSNKATAATTPNSQASTTEQTSGSKTANAATSPNSQAPTSNSTSVFNKAPLTTKPISQTSGTTNHSNTDHSYFQPLPTKKRKLDPTVLPDNVSAILPHEYQYKCLQYEELPGEMIQDSFRVQFCIKDIACKEDVDKWLSKLATSSNIKYNTESGGHARKGKRVLFAGQYICQCKRKKLTKKQEDAKKKAQQRKQLRRQAHPMNTTEDQFDLLSKNRDKKTDCQSKMSVKIFTKRAINEMCEVELWWNHNHSVNSFHLQSFCPILPSTKATFENYFEMGMSVSEAFHHHETKLMQDSVSIMLLADRKYCPSLTDVKNMYGKWQIDRKGAPNGQEMFNTLEAIINEYNKKNSPKGGKCFLQTYENSGNSEKPLIVAICTPLMSRVHHLTQAGEMAFLDASGSLDRFNNPVYFMCTHHPAGALPLGVWITSGQSQHVTKQCLEKLQSVLPQHAFGTRGPKMGPQIFMTDDDQGQRGALSDIWKECQLLLCAFHFLQAVWRWLFNANNNINKDDRQHLMSHFQKLVYSGTEKEFLSAAKIALNDKLNVKYPNFHEYLKRSLKRHREWALCCRRNLLTRGNNTDNYTESMINIFKSVILHRIRAYNLIELFKFITEDLEMYFQRKLLALAFGKTQNLHLAPRCFGATGLTVQLSMITQNSSDPCKFLVPSRSDSGVTYEVNCQTGICSCPMGSNGNPCAHQAAVALKYGIAGINFIPQKPKERFNLAKLAIGNHQELQLHKFVHLHERTSIDMCVDSNDHVVPMDTDSLATPADDSCGSPSPKKEVELKEILKLHKQVSDDIELKLKTTDNNFRACYMKYLEVYRKIISKARGQAPVAALATAFVNFGKDRNGLTLPILHNSRAKIRVQPTSISRRKSKAKSSRSQVPGRKPSLNGVKGLRKGDKQQLKLRKTASSSKRKRNLAENVKLNLPNAGHAR